MVTNLPMVMNHQSTTMVMVTNHQPMEATNPLKDLPIQQQLLKKRAAVNLKIFERVRSLHRSVVCNHNHGRTLEVHNHRKVGNHL